MDFDILFDGLVKTDIKNEFIKEEDVLRKLSEFLETIENEDYIQKELRVHDLRGKIDIDCSLTIKYVVEKSLCDNIHYVLEKINEEKSNN